jgi:integrase
MFEDIPSLIRPEDVSAVLKAARKDQTPVGLRDYAILMLLSAYGLRAGEVTGLRLEDVDWRHDRLRTPRPAAKSFSRCWCRSGKPS